MAKLIPMAKKVNPRKARLEWKEFEAFMDSLANESDRGAVLISAALLDDLLERSIRSLLLDHSLVDQLFKHGSLGTLSSKWQLAFVLGILSESEYQECELIGMVRNKFAHNVVCTFETPEVKEIVSKFRSGSKPESLKAGDPRGRFFTSALILLPKLWRRPSDVSTRRLKYIEPK